MLKVAKLYMCTQDNNNKYYFMFEQSDGTFKVDYGRVDVTIQHAIYPMYQWDKKYKEKINKGYLDRTDLYTIDDDSDGNTKVDEGFISNDSFVRRLIEDLKRWATNTVTANYKVSSKNVTQKMVDEAQNIIDQIARMYASNYKYNDINQLLLKLFTIIPRKMSNVKDYLIRENDSNDRIGKIIDEEQSLLDTMAGQVSIQEPKKEVIVETEMTEIKGLLDNMGIEVEHITNIDEINMIKKLMGDSAYMFSEAFKVRNFNTEKRYNALPIENEQLLWHGSRNQNFLNILKTGLLIRPSCAIYTASMFGDGLYYATKAKKSLGYTSLSGSYWANGNEHKAYLALFTVNLGKQKHIYSHTSECNHFTEKNIYPYNSVFAHAGNSLYNDELIVYNTNRASIRYLIEVKK